MRAAVFSDVHGNLAALDVVLADAAGADVDEFWVVGDLVAHGPDPGRVVRRLMSLPNARVVRGNTDRYVLTGDLRGMIPAIDQPHTPAQTRVLVDVACSFAWTRGAVTAVGGYEWLAALPLEHRTTLPDGTDVLLVHASPGRDDGPGVQATMTDQELLAIGLTAADASLIFVGHTHLPLDRKVAGVRVVNLGSVSLPATTDRRAMWTLLIADEHGISIKRQFADYDTHNVARALDAAHHPSAGYLKSRLHQTR